MSKAGFVYIMSNQKNGTLYIGVTSDLIRRVYQHKNNLVEGFTQKYALHNLVYYESFYSIMDAIAREKQLKNWRREWKVNQIKSMNPDWHDLYDGICGVDPETSSG